MDISHTTGSPSITPTQAQGTQSTYASNSTQQAERSETVLDTVAFLNSATLVDSSANAGAQRISNSNGAPTLDGVLINFSAEDLAATLLVLQGKTQEAQLATAKEGLQISRDKMKALHEKNIKKLDEVIKKCESAASKSKLGKIFGWVAKVAAFVAAGVALALTVASGGAAAPLLALAIVGMVGSAMSMASSISQELGGPPLELGSLATMASKAFLGAVGVPADKLEAAAKLMGGALAVGLAPCSLLIDNQLLSNVATGIAELGGANAATTAYLGMAVALATGVAVIAVNIATGGGSGISKLTDLVKNVPNALHTGAKLTQGAMTVAEGTTQILSTTHQFKADQAQVDRQKFSALLVKLQAQMEEDQEQIKKVVQEIQDGYTAVSQMIAAAGESRAQISANIGHKTMA